MPKQIIAIDVDDVLGSQNDAMRQFINQTYGYAYSAADYAVEGPYWGYWEKVWDVDDIEGQKRVDAFIDAGGHHLMQPTVGAIDAIRRLKQNYDLVVITAREQKHAEDTHNWLEKHFPKAFGDVRFVPTLENGEKMTKAAICKELGANYLVDDHYDHCVLAADQGIECVLFGEFGWNRQKSPHIGITACKDWAATEEFFYERSS